MQFADAALPLPFLTCQQPEGTRPSPPTSQDAQTTLEHFVNSQERLTY